jgi:hypothetical protein
MMHNFYTATYNFTYEKRTESDSDWAVADHRAICTCFIYWFSLVMTFLKPTCGKRSFVDNRAAAARLGEYSWFNPFGGFFTLSYTQAMKEKNTLFQ